MNLKLKITFLIVFFSGLIFFSGKIFAHNESSFNDFDKIDSFIKQEMANSKIPGLSVGVVNSDHIVYLKGFGKADSSGREIQPQTSFLLGSVSKPITAIAVMQLVDQNKIQLDDPVQKHLTSFRVKDTEASKKITIRHLLLHTSGIPSSADFQIAAPTLEQRMKNLQNIELISKPGETYHYAGPNFQILAMIVQQVSGQPFEEYLKKNIFIPLEMNNTFTSQEEAQKNGMTVGHQYMFGMPVEKEIKYEKSRLASGQMISSAEDMSHLLLMLMNGGEYKGKHILSNSAVRQMYNREINSSPISIGLSWRISKEGDIPIIWHGGQLPHFMAEIFMVPNTKWGVIVLGNSASMLDENITERIARGVIRIVHDQEPAIEGTALSTRIVIVNCIAVGFIFWKIIELIQVIRNKHKKPFIQIQEKAFLYDLILPVLKILFWPIIIFVLISLYTKIPIAVMLQSVPDIMLVLAIGIGIDFIKAIIPAIIFLKSMKKSSISHKT